MPSNKVAALTLIGLLMLQLVPSPATAQSTAADLRVTRLEIGTAVKDLPVRVELTVRNVGTETFQSAAGWQIFLGWNGVDETNCIDSTANTPVARQTSVCYQRIPVNDTRNEIRGGSEVKVWFYWVPKDIHVDDGNANTPERMIAVIESTGTHRQTAIDVDGDNDGDGGTNYWEEDAFAFTVFVAEPWVRAHANRVAPDDGPSATPNTPWRHELVTADCLPQPAVMDVACRAKPGTLVEFSYRVRNDGNAQDAFTASISDPNPPDQQYVRRGYQFFFNPPSVTLQPNETGEVNLLIFVPENETAGRGINNGSAGGLAARATWRSSLNPAIDTGEACSTEETQRGFTECVDPTLPTVLAKTRHGMWIGSNLTWATLNARESFQFNMTINNTGNSPAAFRARWDRDASTINDSWQPRVCCSRISLAKDAVSNATISIVPPENATAGFYRITLVAESLTDSSAPAQSITYIVELRPRYNLTGFARPDLVLAIPDETITYGFHVQNHGNAVNNVTLRFEASGTAGNWERSISATDFVIPPFSTYPVTVTVRAPPNTVNDTEGSFYVNVTSRDPADRPENERTKANLKAFARILRASNARVDIPIDTAYVDPGSTTSFDVNIRNTGNILDNFTLEVKGDRSWAPVVSPPYLRLNPLESGTVRVTVRAPGVSEIGATSKFFLDIASSVDPTRVRTVNVTARVSGPDLFVEGIGMDVPNVYSGDEVALSILMGNRGNKAPTSNVTLRVEYIKDGVPVLIGEERVFAAGALPGGLRITERVLWNTSGIEGPVILRARIDPDNAIKEIDDGASSNEATRAVTVRVFDIRVTAAEGLAGPPGVRLNYGERPNVFVLEYRGNQDNEPVKVVVESEHGWGRAEMDLGLRPFTPVLIPVEIRIPQSPGVARDTLRLTVTPTLRPQDVIVSTATTTVLDEVPPRFLDVSVTPETAKLGEEVRIEALVQDETGVRDVRAFVVQPGGGNGTRALVLAHEGGGRYAVVTTFDQAGQYRYYVSATDNSDAANTNSTSDIVRTFRITPSSVPTIQLAANQSATIRTGSPILLSIHDPLGVAKANYTIRGITHELPAPFDQIDTSSFTAGTVDITVAAENLYGGASSQRFSFQIDNTPPTIRSVTMSPTTPAPNEETRIRVETDQDVVGVDIAIKRGGQIVETRAATKQQGNAWETTLNPAAGDYVVDVTARDAAGNARLQQDALTFSAKAPGFFGVPGFEAALLALAAVGVALALRRRAA